MALTVSVDEIVAASMHPVLIGRPDWKTVRLGDIALIQNGGPFDSTLFSKSEGRPLIRIRDIARTTTETRFNGDFDQSYVVRPGDLLVGMDGDFNCARWKGQEALLNQRVCCIRLKSTEYDERFLDYVLPSFLKAINDATSSVTVKHLSSRTVADIPLPGPPIHIQRSIASELDRQFSRLDEAVAGLQRVKANLKRYKAAVLKAAVEGRLVETEADLARREDPANWRDVPLSEVAQITGGLTKNPKRQEYPQKLPYLRVANVYANELRLNEIEYIGVTDKEVEKLLLRRGDMLVVEGNGSPDQIGRVALWDGSIANCVHQNHLIKVRFGDEVVPEWALIWLLSPGGRHEIEQVSSSTSGLHTLSTGKVGRLPMPLPPILEQRRIVAEVDRLLSIAREAEAEVETNLKRAQSLRQAILARAFQTGAVPPAPTLS